MKDFLKNRKISFYFVLASIVLFFGITIAYVVSSLTSQHSDYTFNVALLLIPLVTILASAGLLISKKTVNFAPAVICVGQFMSFLIFISTTYIYLSDKFFEMSDVASFFKCLGTVNVGYTIFLVGLLVIFVLTSIAIFMGVEDDKEANKEVTSKLKFSKPIFNTTKIVTYVLALVTGIAFVGGDIAIANSSAINGAFGIQTQVMVESEKDEGNKDKYIYYKSDYKDFKSVLAGGKALSKEVVAEGITLLKNDNNALPLKKHAAVSLFGSTSVFPAYSGTGSGAWVDSVEPGSDLYKTGFETAGLTVNEDLFEWYQKNAVKYCRENIGGTGTTYQFNINDAKWAQVTTDAKIDSNYGDAAIYIIGRQGGEGMDLRMTTGDKDDAVNGDILTLGYAEIDMLRNLKKEKDKGTFQKIILIMNSAYQVCGLEEEDFGIDAILWTGSFGSRSTEAIGELLNGTRNFSGRLSSLFWTRHNENPANKNFGAFTYKNSSGNVLQTKYVVYQEGIYIGYRYAETRYEDVVTNRDGVGEFNYYDAVSYPFGYGLSYTNFEYSDFAMKYNEKDDTYSLSVKVTNTGKVAGKEVVQFYLSKPYTSYDQQNLIEKPSVELVQYEKTKELAPGESEVLTSVVDRRELASYDSYKKQTYILEAGKYYFTAARDSHDATNNVLRAKGVAESKLSAHGNTKKGNTSLVKEVSVSENDYKTYTKSANGTEIKNAFDCADIFIEEAEDSVNRDSFEYTTRSSWESTLPKKAVSLTRSATMNELYDISQGKTLVKDLNNPMKKPTYNAQNNLQLIDLRAYDDGDDDPTNDVWIPYDDPLWDKYLDQLTFEEEVHVLSDGLRHTLAVNRLGKPETLEHNGAVGFKNYTANTRGSSFMLASSADLKDYRKTLINYPCNGIVASTFNKPLTEELGVQWGEDGLWTGHNILYGPGVNIMRSAYNGRNFEYYSEDPVLSGYQVVELSEGMSKKGAGISLKHCLLNDQETSRHGINTWANEQTIREIYLKPFQIAIEKGGVEGVMTGFNCLGPVWTSAQGFVKQVLKGEFGMLGVAITDFLKDYMKLGPALLNGNDIPDGQRTESELMAYKEGYVEIEWAMRDSMHHIMYQTVHTNVMNGFSANTAFVNITPGWINAINAAKIISVIVLSLSVIGLGFELVLKYKEKYYEA